jgi:hypothetical protein
VRRRGVKLNRCDLRVDDSSSFAREDDEMKRGRYSSTNLLDCSAERREV